MFWLGSRVSFPSLPKIDSIRHEEDSPGGDASSGPIVLVIEIWNFLLLNEWAVQMSEYASIKSNAAAENGHKLHAEERTKTLWG